MDTPYIVKTVYNRNQVSEIFKYAGKNAKVGEL